MYQNRDNLQLGKDYFNLKTGEYEFTYIYDGDERVEIEGFDVPETVTQTYGTSTYVDEVWAFVKGTDTLIDESDLSDICYENVMVTKERLDELAEAKAKIQAILDDAKVKEPFIYEGGKLSVGKEHVLSAHINAGYNQGWISSSICW